MMHRFFITAAAALWLCFCGALAQAQEKITSFDVTLNAAVNGDFDITETISVIAEGNQIKRGIFRDLPRYYLEGTLEVPFRYTDMSVTRNGRKEPFSQSSVDNAVRLLIGDEDVFLPRGEHVYEIRYRVKDQIRRGDTYDAVYWNVTGNDWKFKIDSASVRVAAPEGAYLRYQKAFTGTYSDTGEDAAFTTDDGVYIYETTRALSRYEGLTVDLRFNKGTFAATPDSTKRFVWWARHGAMLILSGSILFLLQYYLRHWRRVGRDPAQGPVFARYAPPKNYSAAAVSYIHHNGLSGNKALIATLMGLAAKKWVEIETGKKETTIARLIEKNGGEKKSAPLSTEEAYLYERLFPKSNSAAIVLKKGKPHSRFAKAALKFSKHVSKTYSDSYFRWNIGYILLGLVLSLLALGAAVSQYRTGSLPGFGWGVFVLVAVNVLFVVLLPAPTQLGQKMRTEIKGLRLYLKTAEKGRFDAVEIGSDAPPPMSAKLYESLLPFAIALGVEDPWTEYFEKAVPTEAETYSPVWNNTGRMQGASLSSSIGLAMSHISSGVSSAAPQSSGTSSSSGGGFSGGGGGGGGGGGW